MAAARYVSPEGTNNGIRPGDTVYTYEQNLNFSVFRTSTGLIPTVMATKDSGGYPINPQQLDSHGILRTYINAGSYADRYYWPYNSTDSTWGTSSVIITNADIGDILIRPYADVTPPATDPPLTTIPYDMNVQFRLEDTNLNAGNYAGPWYGYELTSQSRTWSSVINMAGNPVSLTHLITDPTLANATLAFSMRGQNVSDNDLASLFSMKFQSTLDATTAFPTRTVTFTVKKFTLSAVFSPSPANMGETVTLTVSGKPYTWYTIVIDNTTDGTPYFPATGTYDLYTSRYNVRVHPDSTGTVRVPVYIPVISGDYSGTNRFFYAHVTETNNPSQTATAQLAVGSGTTTSIKMEKPDLDTNKFFCVGDTVPVRVTPGSDVTKAYFFITGPNLCENGAKPDEPWICTIDGDNSTFDVLPVSSDADNIFLWDTMNTGLASGTYRLFGVPTQTGYANRTFAAGNAEDYIDIDLMDPSINAKFPEEAPGFFAQGDYIVSLWTARGSPGKGVMYTGKIRWYILGTNYRYTGITTGFPLIKTDESSSTIDPIEWVLGGNDWPGYSGLNFGRDYSASLDKGEYYVIYQHPMNNNAFDIYPAQGQEYTGAFDTILSTSGGKQLDLSTMQTSDALTAMLDLLEDPNIDDSMLTDRFSIQSPLISMDPVLEYEIGDEVPVTGTTNLQEKIGYPYNQIDIPADEITLALYSSEMYYAGKTQSTYRIYSAEGTIRDLQFGTLRRKVSFSIPKEITAQMKPGEYVAVITCEDIKYTTEITFVLHEQGYRKKNGIAEPETGPEFSSRQSTTVSAAGAAGQAAVATQAATIAYNDDRPPATAKSPAFGGIAVAAVFLAAFTVRALGRCPP